MGIRLEDVQAFAHGRATKEQIERIAEDLERPDSLTRKYLDEFSARVTGFLDNIAWGRLLDLPPIPTTTHEPIDSPSVISSQRSLSTTDDPKPYWFEGAFEPRELSDTPIAWAALLVTILNRAVRVHPLARQTRAKPDADASEREISVTEIEHHLAAGAPITFSDANHWLHLTTDVDEIQLRAGESPAEQFQAFAIDFQASGRSLFKVESQEGVITLRVELLKAAMTANAEVIIIQPQ